MTENALTTYDFGKVKTRKNSTSLQKYASSNRFLRRIQVCGGDAFVKQGKIQPGHIGVPQSTEEILDFRRVACDASRDESVKDLGITSPRS